MSEFYKLHPKLPSGEDFDFSQLKGKVTLIVNVASKCGFTPQYAQLEKVYNKFPHDEFVILGFPCNQFGHQEPGTAEEIATFCTKNYGVTFPILKKVEVNGDGADPVYKYLKAEKSGLLGLTRIKWNFEKFLIDKNGKVVSRHASLTSPESLIPEIEKLIKE